MNYALSEYEWFQFNGAWVTTKTFQYQTTSSYGGAVVRMQDSQSDGCQFTQP